MIQVHFAYQKNGFNIIEEEINSLLRDNPRWTYLGHSVSMQPIQTAGIPPVIFALIVDERS